MDGSIGLAKLSKNKKTMSVVYIFFILAIFSSFIDVYGRDKKVVLILLCIILTLIVGLRDIDIWPDTFAYAYDFEFYTTDLFDFKFNSVCYGEGGFYILSSIIKTITSNSTIYLTIISALTFYCLYKVLQKYSVFPLIGLCIYVARFIFGRNFMQIRAALAIVLFFDWIGIYNK